MYSFIEQYLHVSQHDFIFSHQFRHRIVRHAAFWLACYVFFMISFNLPYGVFPGWNTEKFAGNVARIGLLKWLILRLKHSSGMFIPIMFFAYTTIYLLLPRLFFNKKKLVITSALFIVTLIVAMIGMYYTLYFSHLETSRINPAVKTPIPKDVMKLVPYVFLFNYPIIGGFAVIIKMMKKGWLKQQETEQVAREKVKVELQILKGQIHPHFLFNTLNNIYFFTLTTPYKAVDMLTKLTGILRYLISECSEPFVPLEKELRTIQDYVALEKIRYGDRLHMVFEIKGDYQNKMINPLLLIPLVENSFKHGSSKMLENPWINLNIAIEDKCLSFLLSNSKPEVKVMEQSHRHIGLENVKKRLQLLYPGNYRLNITENAKSFEVFINIPLRRVIYKSEKTETIEYADA